MYKINQSVKVRVTKIAKTHIMVKLLDNPTWTGIIHISEISDYLVRNINSFFNVNDVLYLNILKIDERKKFISFSYKNIRPRFLKSPYKFNLVETENKAKKLIEQTIKEVNND